ncbi:MAG: sigma-70 family RNA polymerase sigma factor [Dermatophilaceae bacterium]
MPLDEEAVAQIYRDHAPLLRRLVLRATGDPQQAEDIVQEVILRVWRQAPPTTHLRAYLTQSARNLVIDGYRASQRRPQESGTPPEQHMTGHHAAFRAPEEIDRALDQLLMHEALSQLSSQHRDVVIALHYQRLTVAEAAERLDVPEGTVKSRAYYALRHLRSVLDEMGVTQ